MTTTAENTQLQAKSFDAPDMAFPVGDLVQVEILQLGEKQAHRATFRPGFRWTEHLKPMMNTDLCELAHTGYAASGRLGVRMSDGTERELAAGDAFDIPPGHDIWVIGNEPAVLIDFPPEGHTAHESAAGEYVPPKDHTVLLENDRVRVLELRNKPGETTGMHSHPPCVVYALSSARARFSFPDGTSREVDIQKGIANWSDGGWHDVENIGETDDWGIIVELKS